MGEFIILYILIVGGLASYFLYKDATSNSSNSNSTDQSTKVTNNLNNDSIKSDIYYPTPRKKKPDEENYVHHLDNSFLNKKNELDDLLMLDNKGQGDLGFSEREKQLNTTVKKKAKYKQNHDKLTKKSKSYRSANRGIKEVENSPKRTLGKLEDLTPKVDIQFIEDTHEYYVNGKKVISVSELINRFSSNLNIDNDYINVPGHVLRKAAIKGEALHKEIENYEKNGYESSSIEFYNYKAIKQKLKFNVKHSEIMVAIKNSHGDFVAAGRLDMLVTFGTRVGIIDIKRTWKFYKDKVTAQVNLYRLGLLHTYGINANELICIRLRDTIAEKHTIKNNEINIVKVLDLI